MDLIKRKFEEIVRLTQIIRLGTQPTCREFSVILDYLNRTFNHLYSSKLELPDSFQLLSS